MTILEDIAQYKRREIAVARAQTPLATLEAGARIRQAPRGLLAKLRSARNAGQTGLIAEIKRASPSKGVIRADFDPKAIALAYERAGAQCLSVLTDGPSFQGALPHMLEASNATRLPVLRKDFMLDAYQVAESRYWGADAILVILALVDDQDARTLMDAARAFMLDVLVEVHNEAELTRALALDAAMIGINNRDLHSFETDLGVTERLAQLVPSEKLLVAESGITDQNDIARLKKAGVTTYLVGESLLRETKVDVATSRLLGKWSG